jgi:hypothetical protein
MEIRDLNKKYTENTVNLIKQSEEGIRKEMKDMGARIKKEMQDEMEQKMSGNKSTPHVDSEGFTDAEIVTA